MADAGVPVHVLRMIAGHGSITTTQRYLHQGSGIAAGGRETAGHEVNAASERRLQSVRDTRLTSTDRHLIASDAGYARWPRWPDDSQSKSLLPRRFRSSAR